MPYEITTERFTGPLPKLLSLIEERELEITEVSLAKVTDDFFVYLKTLQEVPPAVLADFVAVASRLILIKSKVLLPDLTLTQEEEAEIHELEERLAFYKLWKPAQKAIALAWLGKEKMWGRPYFLNTAAAFYPSVGLTADALLQSLNEVLRSLETYTRETETIKETIIAIEEKIAEVLTRLTQGGSMSFKVAVSGEKIAEVVALFLAVLHLAREGKVYLDQTENFSDIIVAHPRSK
ncbi:MAG: hypothetical protein FJY98_04560 [Candidatus Liptonbacteria bacterium]|nr:hypothetical protein [Candidatus Liptonbacteria bacterium]